MTTTKARDFLQKELFIRRSVVTFRSLSRELGIHVNEAKNELKTYYESVRDTDTPAVPTYLVTGDIPALTFHPVSDSAGMGTQQSDHAMDLELDMDFEEDREDREDVETPDVVYQSKVVLVDARALDDAMAEFSRIHSVHVYSLSPSRLMDAGLICGPSAGIRNADMKGGFGSFPVVGKISGKHVKLRPGASLRSAASSSKRTLESSSRAPPKVAASTSKAKASEAKEQTSVKTESKEKPKLSGKLDWSKAKTKEKEPAMEKVKEEPKLKAETKSAPTPKASTTLKTWASEAKAQPVSKPGSSSTSGGDTHKRGTKRKPVGDSESEVESESASVSTKAKPVAVATLSTSKKPVVAIKQEEEESDDDDEPQVRMPGRRRLRGNNHVASASERSLQVMMDIDDDEVDRVSRVSKVRPPRKEEEEEEEGSEQEGDVTVPETDVVEPTEGEDSDNDIPIVPKKPRKPRKAVPVGRNGLKKRRVVKSRTTTDAKGYMQTEDYSSYESVDEEEVTESKPKPKAKSKSKEQDKEKEKGTAKTLLHELEETKPKPLARENSATKAKAKPTPKSRGGAPKRGGLLNFFGPERGKK